MEQKFNMPRELNITLAKRNLIDYIWKSANMEGVMVTYSDTEAIFNGVNVAGCTVDDIVLINNLKHAWKFVLDILDYPTDFAFICKVNQLVGSGLYYRAGFLRNIPVSIGGTSWKPELPWESKVKSELEEILKLENFTDRALTLMCFLMRSQLFIDGNKRTAILTANHILIHHGGGIISIAQDQISRFGDITKIYYETGDMVPLKKFLYEECLAGVLIDGEAALKNKEHEELLATFDTDYL